MPESIVTKYKAGEYATFNIRVLFRQNASYQGEIYWLEGEQKTRFRSFLELAVLMQEAMFKSGAPKADYALRTWKNVKSVKE